MPKMIVVFLVGGDIQLAGNDFFSLVVLCFWKVFLKWCSGAPEMTFTFVKFYVFFLTYLHHLSQCLIIVSAICIIQYN